MKKISTGLFITLYFFIYLILSFLLGNLLALLVLLLSNFTESIGELNNANNKFHWTGVLMVVTASLLAGFIVRKRYLLPSSLVKISSIVMLIFFTLNILFVLVTGGVTSNNVLTIVLNVLIAGLWTYIPLFIANRFYSKHTK